MKKAGRKLRYGEPTVPMRIPESMVPAIEEMLAKREMVTAHWDEVALPPEAEKFAAAIAAFLERPLNLTREVLEEHLEAQIYFADSKEAEEKYREMLNHLRVQEVIDKPQRKEAFREMVKLGILTSLSEDIPLPHYVIANKG